MALEGKVTDLRAMGTSVQAAFELKEVFQEKFRRLIERGGNIHVRVEAELWEDRPAWDRLVRPAAVVDFRVARDPVARVIVVADPFGGTTSYTSYPDPLLVRVDVAPIERIVEAAEYYVHAVLTIGTLAEREIEDVNDAVFGRDEESTGIGTIGKFVIGKILQISDYFQRTTTETSSRTFTGRHIRSRN
ncbi:MAG: hypothetical protein HYX76_09445 [Acidobacteria bacterium]|nr:hypothetical protein [Acidobacteriota bacterium]